MLPIESIAALILVFAPGAIWSFPVFRNYGFRFSDNLVWWLAGIQAAALSTLWVERFEFFTFVCVFLTFMVLVTVIRLRVVEDRSANSDLTVSDGFLASLIVVAIWVPANVYADVPRIIDSLTYHLPMAAQWVQTRSIMAQDSGVWFYPGGYELLTSVFFLIGSGDFLWFVPDLLSWTLLVVSIHSLFSTLGVNRNASSLMVGAIVLSPVVLVSLSRGYNDLFVAALAVSAVTAFARAELQDSRQARATGLVCLGALVCTKYSAFLLVLFLIPFVVLRRGKTFRPFGWLETFAIIVAAVLLMSFPLRNLLITGNPIFPVGVKGLIPWGDTSLLVASVPKISPEQLTSTALIHHPWAVWRIFFRELGEWAAFLPVLAALAVAFRLFKNRVLHLGRIDCFVLAAAFLSLVGFITQPLVVDNHPGSLATISSGVSLRFGLTWIILVAAWFFSKIPVRFSLITASALFILPFVINDLFQYAVVILLANFVLYLIGRFSGPRITYAGFLVPLALAAVPLVADHARPLQAANAYTVAYISQVKSGIAEHVQQSRCSQVIILSTGLKAWPLIGHDLKNRVVQVGMSQPAEEFRQQANLHDATMIIVPRFIQDGKWPSPGRPFAEMERIGQILGPEWRVGYDDGVVIAYTRGNEI